MFLSSENHSFHSTNYLIGERAKKQWEQLFRNFKILKISIKIIIFNYRVITLFRKVFKFYMTISL